jgi:hypothetical protein
LLLKYPRAERGTPEYTEFCKLVCALRSIFQLSKDRFDIGTVNEHSADEVLDRYKPWYGKP